MTVIASDYDYLNRRPGGRKKRSEVTAGGVRFVWLQTGSYTGNDRRRVRSMLSYTWRAFWAAVRLRPRPAVIIASSPHPLAGLAGSVAARALGIPWVFEVRDFWPSALLDLGAFRRGGLTHRALLLVERMAYTSSARVVVVPPRGHLRLRELGLDERKVAHIPNGTQPERVRGPLPATLDTVLQTLRGKFLIVYAGALGVPQSFESTLEGMARLRERDNPMADGVALLLIGSGVRREQLVKRVHDLNLTNVLFHPPVPKSAIGTVLAKADACLIQLGALDNFKYGLSPNKLFDYFGAAKPVLIASAYPTVVDETSTGVRFRPGDPDAFADAVVRLIQTSVSEREAMGERGRELVRTRYSLDAIAGQYEHLIEEVAVEHR